MSSFTEEKRVLGDLAKRYLEHANSERNLQNIKKWRDHNDLKVCDVMIMVDQLPWHELNYDGGLDCVSAEPFLKNIELDLRKAIYKWENFDTNQTLNPYIEFKKGIYDSGIGVEVNEEQLKLDAQNDIVAHDYKDQLTGMQDVEKLKTPTIEHLPEETNRRTELLVEVLGPNTPIKAVGVDLEFRVWDKVTMLRSVTSILFDFIDEPELLHAIMRRFTDIELATMKQLEKQNLLYPDATLCHCSGTHNSSIPIEDEHNTLSSDCWAYGMAQVFSSGSPAMLKEFELEYAKEYYAHVGLVNYGCCEPLHNSIDDILQIKNIRKISVSPWADPLVSAQKMQNKVIMARKPNPAFLATGSCIDADSIRTELRTTIDACRANNTACELILKDISTVNYEPQRVKEWIEIARQEIEK